MSLDKLDVQASGLKPEEDPNRLLLNKLRTAALESGPEEHPNKLVERPPLASLFPQIISGEKRQDSCFISSILS